jgi:hypothetical protein
LGGQSVALQGASSVESLETKIIQFCLTNEIKY